jgi:hypothetical protein
MDKAWWRVENHLSSHDSGWDLQLVNPLSAVGMNVLNE